MGDVISSEKGIGKKRLKAYTVKALTDDVINNPPAGPNEKDTKSLCGEFDFDLSNKKAE